MAQTKNRPKVQVRTGLKAGAGGIDINHGTRVRIRTGVKAGGPGINLNHGTRIRVR